MLGFRGGSEQEPQPFMLSYRLDPEPPDPSAELDESPNKPFGLRPVFSGEMFLQVVSYPVIVEMWEKVAGRYSGGRRKRAYLATFTEAERRALSRYYGRFYRWYLVTGTPRQVILRLSTLNLLQRAVAFFATV